MNPPISLEQAEAVRHFNRFYTQHIGVLHERLQKSPFSLTEVRVLRELACGRAETASGLTRNLGLDSGYLSRLLTSFEHRGLITRRPSSTDARQSLLALTDDGRAAYEPLEAAAINEVSALLARLAPTSRSQLLGSMKMIERLLDNQLSRSEVTIRTPQPGDLGWIVHRQVQLFAASHDCPQHFESQLAQVVADITRRHEPSRETCLIATQLNTIVGSAAVVADSPSTAAIRLFYVEPDMQRSGIGAQLLEACASFALNAGYQSLQLTTLPSQINAKRLCARSGFVATATSPFAEHTDAASDARCTNKVEWVRQL
ncbi:bifunctional helix-turn-helix transcriptional regulator/GNAT family N-acetyltransferase [Paraburkholderia bonniea]|uniref:bifunctional helix-turn-helix transcriptional regulator/GNAT family N-acetyltransferase n=1 Tax=Paraburkholderia bonniea TaxID=2152891 RepID=UPI0012922F3F|nr:bifunctional helix-turn-helix transcriptional regulator/GNAT family N-acetyltransferase [Paraburkholderia bonniea]WJF89976.1 bifunctional helix-turn-helix transcriptional regulator/GNAT family N-acetyltransferase [Paraburkholderia bonniea]WJF93290.1 bifunctional helix-turn-helix transcriptional regulator/GNAT family N-acetyltransferase [Paraburkholderia bonniea]